MAAPEAPDNLEGLAFQLILHKLSTLERAMQGIPPLLEKIVRHLEVQAQQPEVPLATYAQLYPEIQEVETPQAPIIPETSRLIARKRRLWQWFVKEG